MKYTEHETFWGTDWYTVGDWDQWFDTPHEVADALIGDSAPGEQPERVEIIAYAKADASEERAAIAARLRDMLDAEIFDLCGEGHAIDTRRAKDVIGNAIADLFHNHPGIVTKEVGRRTFSVVLDDDGELGSLDEVES